MGRQAIKEPGKLFVNICSESEFTIQGHGVHTAYLEMRRALEKRPDVYMVVNAEPQKLADVTHLHTIGTYCLRRLISPRGGLRVESAHIVPASLDGSLKFFSNPFGQWWAKLWLRWCYNRADLVIAVSEYTRQELLKMGVKKPIEILENSIDTTLYATTDADKKRLRKNLKLDQKKFTVVGNGQIQPRKRFETFLAVAERLPDLQFVWVGGIPFGRLGADSEHLTKLMHKPPKNVRITGVVPLAEARDYMRASDIMFNPSAQETFGLAIIEAAASGLPIVVRDIPDYDETFGDFVLRGRTDEEFIQLIEKLRTDAKFYTKMRADSARLAAKYDSAVQTEKLIQLYKKYIARKNRAKRK
jgi:1,2-diacylglycerol-3-alpha-glucose alpha-1,2-galactosyltransferase